MIATTRTTVVDVQRRLLGAVDVWWLAADAVDLQITTLVAVDSPTRGWAGHGLSGGCPVALAAWILPDTEFVQIELATDAVDDAEHQELVLAVEGRLGDRLLHCGNLPAAEPAPLVVSHRSVGAQIRAQLGITVTRIGFLALLCAIGVVEAMVLTGGHPAHAPDWLAPVGQTPGALATLAGGWLAFRLGILTAAIVDPHEDDDLWAFLGESAVPVLLAAAVVALGAGWVA